MEQQRIKAIIYRQPFAVAVGVALVLLFSVRQLAVINLVPLPAAVAHQAFETIAETWCLTAMPALWFVERRRFVPLAVFAAAVVPAVLAELALFAYGSVIATAEELERNLQIVLFAVGVTAIVGCASALVIMLLRRAPARVEHGHGA